MYELSMHYTFIASKVLIKCCNKFNGIETTGVTIKVGGGTGTVVSVADYVPKGPRLETWPRHSLLWP